MESITLQTGDTIITSGDKLGQLQFAASAESDGSAARLIAAQVYAQAEGSFGSASNPTSLILATAAADASAATARIKITDKGHIIPVTTAVSDLGDTNLNFRRGFISEGIVLASNTPADTTNKLYSTGGSLYFNGSVISIYTAGSGIVIDGLDRINVDRTSSFNWLGGSVHTFEEGYIGFGTGGATIGFGSSTFTFDDGSANCTISANRINFGDGFGSHSWRENVSTGGVDLYIGSDLAFGFDTSELATLEGTLYFKERAAAATDKNDYGQIWVKNTTPCELWFTDDAGTDTQVGDVLAGASAASTRVGYFTSASTIDGSSSFTWNNTTKSLTLGGNIFQTIGTSHYISEKTAASGDVAGYGQIWVENLTPNRLRFTDDAGNDFVVAMSGTGGGTTYTAGSGIIIDANDAIHSEITKVGTPADNQVAVWTGDGTIEGDSDFKWNGTSVDINLPSTVANQSGLMMTVNNNPLIGLQEGIVTSYGGAVYCYSGTGGTSNYVRFQYGSGYPKLDTTAGNFTFQYSTGFFRLGATYCDIALANGVPNTAYWQRSVGNPVYITHRVASAGSHYEARDESENVHFAVLSDGSAAVANGGSLFIKEKAAALGDVVSSGQLWVKDDSANSLFFTDDAGWDHRLTGKHGTLEVVRTLPTTVDDIVEIGTISMVSGTACFWITAVCTGSGFSVAKTYMVAVQYNGSINWTILTPISDTGAYTATQNYELEIQVGATDTSLRARRTLGSLPGSVYLTIKYAGIISSFTEATGTSGVAPITTYFPNTQIVTKVGTPVDNQVAVWTADGFIEGDTDFLWNGSQLSVNTTSANNLASITTGGGISIKEQAAAGTDASTFGQLWVKNDAPSNSLYFTDDTGLDRQITGNFGTITVERQIPVAVDDAIDIGTLVGPNGGICFRLTVSSDGGGFVVSKTYLVPTHFNGALSWEVLAPISETGSFSSNDFEVDILSSGANCSLRIRKTLGTASSLAYVTISYEGRITSFTESSTVNSVTAPTDYYKATSITQKNDRVYLYENLQIQEGTIYIAEQASADADIAGYGQIWIHDDSPNTLRYTDDAGSDYNVVVTQQGAADRIPFFNSSGVVSATDELTWTGFTFRCGLIESDSEVAPGNFGRMVMYPSSTAAGSNRQSQIRLNAYHKTATQAQELVISASRDTNLIRFSTSAAGGGVNMPIWFSPGGTSGVYTATDGSAYIHDLYANDVTIGQPFYINEASAAGGDVAGKGQLWVKDDTPNTLFFTDDAGTDRRITGTWNIVEETRSVPTTVDDTIDIGSITTSNGAGIVYMSVVVDSPGFSVCKEYQIPMGYNNATAWERLIPFTEGRRATATQDFDVDINQTLAVAQFRIRRTVGTTAGTALVQIKYSNATSYVSSSSTASVTAPTDSYQSTSFGQYGDQVFIYKNLNLSSAFKTPLETVSDGTLVTFDCDVANLFTVTLGGNRSLAVTNADVGQRFIVRITQDGTGGRSIAAWFSTIKWPGGLVPTLTATANKTDVFGFICTSAGNYDGYVIGYNL